MVRGTTSGVGSIDGFISDTANYTPTKEPFMIATESIGGQQVLSANFYQFNPYIDEADYDAAMYSAFVAAGFPASIGFLIDTSRNGWGSSNRPIGPSASLDLNTFVNASKIDLRNARGQWCNQTDAGLGVPPTANPPGFFPQLQAFVWVKPPGESDGTYATSTAFEGGNADENCDPAHINALANNTLTGALPNPPSAGLFFPAQFTMLVQNAQPAVPVSGGSGTGGTGTGGTGSGGGTTAPSPSYTLSAAPNKLSVAQGASTTTTIDVAPSGGFAGNVAFGISGLQGGVTATFAPVSSSASTQLTLAAGSSAVTGLSVMTITGTSGTLSANTTLALTVTPTAVTPPPVAGGGGPATAAGAVGTSGQWFDQDNVALNSPTAITALTLIITVPAGNVTLNGMYNTVGGQIVDSSTTAGGNILFTFALKAGQQLYPGNYTFAAQLNGNGSAVHNATGDSWSLTYTAGGVSYAQSGTI